MQVEKSILIVDDSVITQIALGGILSDAGYTVRKAMNGREALDILSRGTPQVSLVLLDIMMPIMDGLEVLDSMKKSGLLATIPVVVMTSDNQPVMEYRCLEAGASDFLKKPYSPALVRQRVGNIFRLLDSAKLASSIETDRLTGIYNKEFFFLHAEQLLGQSSEREYMMLYLNLVDFKMLNAHRGMEKCDLLLQHIAKCLRESVGGKGICGRIGSDTFGVLMEQAELTQEIFGKYLAAGQNTAPIRNANLKCGVFLVKDKTMSVTVMCDCAKIAEESIKSRYGIHYAIYDDSMSRAAMREHQLSNYMEEALEKGQFLVYLQPKHNTETAEIAGAEALVRWDHPDLGFIAPTEFIPLFERNGFIVKLDYYVWERVCAILRGWLDAGIRPIPISVNASRADFVGDELAEKLDALVDQYDIPPELLHIEVTESAYTDHPQQIVSVIATLRDMGFKIEMDDFGSGYSSLNMLSELPIDILKLDMRFLQSGNEQLKGSKRNILSFIVSLSKWLQLPTIAEGVETREEVDALRSMGCNFIQGYYYSKPLPLGEFEIYLKNHRQSAADESAAPQAQPSAQTDAASGDKPLVLVVEDIESNRRVIASLLSGEYRIATAENGAVAYEYIKANHGAISCILLDLLMPVMDGFQLLEQLRRDRKYSDIPIIITTETGNAGELRALSLGAHSFVAKPYNPDVLRHHIRKAVEEKGFLAFKREYLRKLAKKEKT